MIAQNCCSKDLKKFNEKYDIVEARALVQADWDACDGSCVHCHRPVIGLGATNEDNQASLDRARNSSGVSPVVGWRVTGLPKEMHASHMLAAASKHVR